MCRMEIRVRRVRLSTSRSERKEDCIETVSQQYRTTLKQSLQCRQWVYPCKKWIERWNVDLSQETGVNIQTDFLELHIVICIVLHRAIRHGLMRLSRSVILFRPYHLDQSQNITDVFSICFGEERGILAIGDIDDGLYVIHFYQVI